MEIRQNDNNCVPILLDCLMAGLLVAIGEPNSIPLIDVRKTGMCVCVCMRVCSVIEINQINAITV